jgi:glycosyltransferase involved in cell wall biosynthesis
VNMHETVRPRAPVDVSVIIPTYNRARLVVEAIESALRQTTPPREIIVIDDGSTDETPRVLASFGDRIISVRQANQGVGAARNRGLAMARGRYLAFLDSDDTWLEFKLELQVGVMERSPELGLLFSDFLITHENGGMTPHGLQTWYRHSRPWEHVFEKASSSTVGVPSKEDQVHLFCGRIYRALLEEFYVLTSCAIVRRDRLTMDARFTEGVEIYEDWEFFARLARTCDAGFLELDTTINRGGNDRPRVTDASIASKAESRLRMIGSVWKNDADFLAVHRAEVTVVEADQCLVLARARLLDSEPRAARAALRQWLRLGHSGRWREAIVLAICALFPGSGTVLRNVRELLSRLRAPKPTPHEPKRTGAING